MDTTSQLMLQRRSGDSNVCSRRVDRISKLPGEVLSHILSYITTKEAVATSILSKRWEYLWTFTTNLDFSDQITYANEYSTKLRSYKDFVDRVIFYHGDSTIRKCNLHTRQLYSNIYSWVSAVITCNVQELSIQGSTFELQQLPWSLFTCKTLVVLKISGMFRLDLPTRICFPFLKTLMLDGVLHMNDASMDRLFSSCPVLEELDITRQTGAASGEYSMKCSSSLVEVHIYNGCDFNLLNGISKARHIVLTGETLQDLHTINRDHGLPTFSNLKKLGLYTGNTVDWNMVPDLLQCSPKLENLVFPTGYIVSKRSGIDNWHQPDSVPECLLYHLKTVKILSFMGSPSELDLVKYLLEFGVVLERMNILCLTCSPRPIEWKKMKVVVDEVANYKRSSSTCKLVFGN